MYELIVHTSIGYVQIDWCTLGDVGYESEVILTTVTFSTTLKF